MRTRTKKKKKLLIPIIIAVIILLCGTAAIFLITRNDGTKTPGTTNQSGINFGPPTEEDKQEVDRNKEEITNEEDAPPPPKQDGRSVRNPFITYAQQFEGNIELTGYISGIIEEGGTCKAEFTNGGLKVTKETKGFADVNRTSCTPFVIPVSEFSQKGKWQVTLSYSSQSSTGTSNAVEVEVK